ncbi:DUF3592 domain-containing protein [Bacteroides sp.]|uniref:DUF3592 domain-containing protein n=1 Tax=Bacteroides sp. TaxID=29523 RepID=UPI0026158FA0|nr:DUF3592 domain-containing protein [Bacteroides sp.]
MEDMTDLAMMILIPFFCIGVIFIGMGYVIRYFMQKRLRRCSEMVSGKVVDTDLFSVKMNRQVRKEFYRPVIEFTVGKEVFRAVPPNGAVKRTYAIGEDILIYYNPHKLDEIIIRHEYEKEIRKVFLIFLIVGLCIPILGIVLGWLVFMLMDNFI